MMYRNNKLLALAKQAPYCFTCELSNNGTIVAAHSNQQRDGKGTGLKSHDYRIAYICFECHKNIDSGSDSRLIKREAWEEAHRKTVGWLFESGKITVNG